MKRQRLVQYVKEFDKYIKMGGTIVRWTELRMCNFWAGGISSFPFSRAREYRLLRRLLSTLCLFILKYEIGTFKLFSMQNSRNTSEIHPPYLFTIKLCLLPINDYLSIN
jgi:hypothetical protein